MATKKAQACSVCKGTGTKIRARGKVACWACKPAKTIATGVVRVKGIVLRFESANESESILLAHGLVILGAGFHCQAIRVDPGDEDSTAATELSRLESFVDSDGALCTVEIPGYPGRYVLAIYPHSD